MNKRRLLKLADLLEADAKKKNGVKFDLSTWAKPADADSMVDCHFETKKAVPKVDCGTVACAVGLACISGAFASQGLRYGFKKQYWGDGFSLIPKFGTRREWTAVNAFFGLQMRQSNWLFTADDYDDYVGARGERAVAQRIRDFVAGKAAPRL